MNVFLCHNKADKPRIRDLASALRSLGEAVWFDEAQIEPGVSILSRISEGLDEADVLGLCWSHHAKESNWVDTELRAYLRRRVDDHSLRIVPILIDDTPLPVLVADYAGVRFTAGDDPVRVAAEISRPTPSSTRELLLEVLDELEYGYDHGAPPGVSTGFVEIDGVIGGLVPGRTYVVAARPAMGKTTLALNIATWVAIHQRRPVLYASLHARARDLMTRALCSEARVDTQRVALARMRDSDWPRISRAIGTLVEAPLYFWDRPLTPGSLPAIARPFKERFGAPALVVVDPLQALGGSTVTPGAVLEELKRFATDSDATILTTIDLPGSVEARIDKRPVIGDLPDAVATGADVVMFLYQEDHYDPLTPDRGIAEVEIAKNRNGPLAILRLVFLRHIARFATLADPDPIARESAAETDPLPNEGREL